MQYPYWSILILTIAILLTQATSSLAQSDSLKAEQFYKNGKELYYDGGYKKAIKQFRKAYDLQVKIYGEESEPVMKSLYRLGQAYRKMRDHPNALKVYTEGLEIARKISGDDSEDVIDFYWGLGATQSQMYNPKGAIAYYEKCLDAYLKIYGPESSEVGNMYMNIGSSFHKMTNYHDAEKYYQKAFEIFTKSSAPKSEDFNRIYSNMGYMYRKVGNYDRAIDFGEKALEIKLLHYDSTHPSVGKYYRNIAKAYQGKNEYEKALPYMLKTVKNQEKALGKKHPETGGSYGELGNLYADIGAYKTALKYFEKARKIQEANLSPTHPYLVGGYFNIGTVYEEMGDPDKAISMYRFALDKFKSRDYPPQNLIAETQRRIAKVLFQNEATDSALMLIQKSFQSIVPDFSYEEEDKYKNPGLEKIQDLTGLLTLLDTKAGFLEGIFKQKGNQKDLEEAFITIELAIETIEKLRGSYPSEEARQFLNSKTSPIYKKAIQLAYDLFEQSKNEEYLFKAFQISEKSKASILWQNLSENLALQSTSIPEKELDILSQLEVQIADLEEQLYKEEDDKLLIDNLKSKIFDLKLKYEKQISGIEEQNPKYYQSKYQTPVLDLVKLIQKLPGPGSVLIEYFYDDTYLYAFLISKAGLSAKRTAIDKSFFNKIKELQKQEVNYLANRNTTNSYTSILHELYQVLIKPIAAELVNKEKLIIIPHGILQYLPFEILITSDLEKDFRRLPYLIHDYTIQYDWSAVFWLNELAKLTKPQTSFAGFAPDYGHQQKNLSAGLIAYREVFSDLTFSSSEVEQANSYFPGSIFTNEQATEQAFRHYAPSARIIHLASHAFTNDIQPLESGLAFSIVKDTVEDGFLNAYEIYNLDLAADLAVLSACNTGYGTLSEGEGVMSLGRAFSYSGCKSIVMSLWLANDQSTSVLISDFYKSLSKGHSKDEALRIAKLNFLEQADPLTAHPYFWAGMVAVGDMSPVSSPVGNNWKPLLFLGIIGLGLLYFLLNRRRKGHFRERT